MKPDETPSSSPAPWSAHLRISSGPVSPRYQYWLRVDLELLGSGPRLTTTFRRPGREEETRCADLAPAAWEAYRDRLGSLAARSLPPLLPTGAPPPAARRVGAPLNEFRLQAGAEPARGFTFGPSLLSEAEGSSTRRIVEDLLDLADSATASGFKVLFRGQE